MRLLKRDQQGEISLAKDLGEFTHAYAILSHTWGPDEDEVIFDDLKTGKTKSKLSGYAKLQFCGKQAEKDKIEYFWVDTCCIDKANHTELSEAITSMFRWYERASRCYVYLSDVSIDGDDSEQGRNLWKTAFRKSRWFTRGWTLPELLAPASVEFYSLEGEYLGSKVTLEDLIHSITNIPVAALRGQPLSDFPVVDRLRWATGRTTKKFEDMAYCLLGIFNVFLPLIYGEGENALKRLQEEIALKRLQEEIALKRLQEEIALKRLQEIKKSTQADNPNLAGLLDSRMALTSSSEIAPVHTHWLVPRSRNPLLTGRDVLLQNLENIVVDTMQSQKQCRIVVTGMGGQGKSEVCLQLAHRVRQSFWGVFWIEVSTTTIAEQSFLDLARRLSLSAHSWEDARFRIARLKDPWLLVLDNADDTEIDYLQYFPDGSRGVVLLTSRNQECHGYATGTAIALEGLAEDESRDLLLKAAQVPRTEYSSLEIDTAAVSKLLQCHPLALIQAGAYISKGYCTLAQYPGVYERERKRLLKFRPTRARSRYGDVYATFEASVELLKASSSEAAQDAMELLPLLAMCGPNRLPLRVFEEGWKGAQQVPLDMEADAQDDEVELLTPWHVARLPSLLQGRTWNSYRIMEAIYLLKSSALVTTEGLDGGTMVSMHPLIHAWAQDRQNEAERQQSWLQLGCIVALSREAMTRDSRHEQSIQPHLAALTKWELSEAFGSNPPVLVARILVNCGWLLHRERAHESLFILLQKLFRFLHLNRAKVTRSWLGLYHLAGRNLLESGRISEGIALCEQVLDIQDQVLPEDHPSLVDLYEVLAGAYQRNCQYRNAASLLERLIKIKESLSTEASLDLPPIQHSLGVAYHAIGDVEDAVTLFESVVKARKQLLPESHPDRLSSQYELGLAYRAAKQPKKAVDLLHHVIEIQHQMLEDSHPDQLASQQALAGAYLEIGNVEGALTLIEQVATIKGRTLPEDYSLRLISQCKLARSYIAMGQPEKAIVLLEEEMEIREQTLVEDYRDQASTMECTTLADTYLDAPVPYLPLHKHPDHSDLDSIQRVTPDPEDIGSRKGSFRTPAIITAEDHLKRTLTQNQDLRELLIQIAQATEVGELGDDIRELLKYYHRDLKKDAHTNLENATANLLRGHWYRNRIARELAYDLKDLTLDVNDGIDSEGRQASGMSSKDLNDWLRTNLASGASDRQHQIADNETNIGILDVTNVVDKDDSSEESSDEMNDQLTDAFNGLPYITLMERFVVEGEAFSKLLERIQLQAITPRYNLLRRTLMSLPQENIEIRASLTTSWFDQIRCIIEDYSSAEWDWWPLYSPRRVCESGQATVLWECHCGTKHQDFLPEIEAVKFKTLLKLRCGPLMKDHLCVGRNRKRRSWRQFLPTEKAFKLAAPTRKNFDRSYVNSRQPGQASRSQALSTGFDNTLTTSPGQTATQAASPQNAASNQQTPHPAGIANGGQHVAVSIKIQQPATLRLLLGTKATRPCLDVDQIDLQKVIDTSDGVLVQKLVSSYRSTRGCLRLWLSVYQLRFCSFKKFLKYRRNRINSILDGVPSDDIDYEYRPGSKTPPNERPPISQQEFEDSLYPCKAPCYRWLWPWHGCIPPLTEQRLWERVPKKRTLWAIDCTGASEAWGLEAGYKISFLHVVFYHVLILAGTFAFWGFWRHHSPEDIQGAAVPVTVVLTAISAFWAAAGVIKLPGEGRDAQRLGTGS